MNNLYEKSLFKLIIILSIMMVLTSVTFALDSTYIIRAGCLDAIGSEANICLDKFKELVEAKTNNRITVKVFPAEQLGGAMEESDALRMGSQEILLDEPAAFDSIYPPASIFGMLYIFRDQEHLHSVLDGAVGKKFIDDMAKKVNIRFIGYYDRLPRHLTSNKPIRSVDDVKNLIIRVPNTEAFVKGWKALGAKPTPMNWGEVYTSLATGLVEAQENPFTSIWDAKLFEVQKYLNLTGHSLSVYALAMNDSFLNKLPKDLQEAVIDAAKETGIYMNVKVKQIGLEQEAKLKEKMEFINTDVSSFKNRLIEAEIWKEFKDIDETLYNEIINTK